MSIRTSFNPMGMLGADTTAPDVLTGVVYVGQLDGLTSADTPRIRTVSVFEQVASFDAQYKRLFQLYQASSGRFFALSGRFERDMYVENNTANTTTAAFNNTGEVDTLELSGEKAVFNGSVLATTTREAYNTSTPLDVSFGTFGGYPFFKWHRFEFYVDDELTHSFEPLRKGGTVGMKDVLTRKIYWP